jgi:hypothetical protein
MKWLMIAATASVAFLPTQSMAMADAECASAWTAADKNRDGFVSMDEGARYYAALRVADKSVAEGKLSQAEFIANCKAGLFDARRVDAGAPLKGANSFTEGQAKDRAVAHGFLNVSQLAKDGDGIWRGTAQLDGKPVKIAIDYKGNVVSQ